MPRRNDISKILIIGSGPIIIGQSAEFDYSGTQACKALKSEGYEVVLCNSNPATIMTDPEMADRTYIEPLTRAYLEEIIRREAEMMNPQQGKFALLPTVGGQTALNLAVELADSVIVVCSIESFDPMGGHTGDSITVAPAQTLSDREYQNMRDAAIRVIRKIGVETGGSNIQFAVDPNNGRMVVIEMNPRVSRSSALASKATGFPIAKIAARLAAGYTLDEIPNDITRKTPACFEPTLDYVAVKIPKWHFEKFPGADENLGPQMKSVGEVMAIGRTFKEALMKGVRALDTGKRIGGEKIEPKILTQRLVTPHPERLSYLRYAIRQGHTVKQLAKMTGIDPWFLYQLKEINDMQLEVEQHPLESVPTEVLRDAKRMGFSDGRLAGTWRLSGKGDQEKIRHLRKKHKVQPVYKRVDTCAAEFESFTPYLYSTYEEEDEATPTAKKKVMILGSW